MIVFVIGYIASIATTWVLAIRDKRQGHRAPMMFWAGLVGISAHLLEITFLMLFENWTLPLAHTPWFETLQMFVTWGYVGCLAICLLSLIWYRRASGQVLALCALVAVPILFGAWVGSQTLGL